MLTMRTILKVMEQKRSYGESAAHYFDERNSPPVIYESVPEKNQGTMKQARRRGEKRKIKV